MCPSRMENNTIDDIFHPQGLLIDLLQAIFRPRCMVMVRIVRIRVKVSLSVNRVRLRVSVRMGMENSACCIYLSIPDRK